MSVRRDQNVKENMLSEDSSLIGGLERMKKVKKWKEHKKHTNEKVAGSLSSKIIKEEHVR